MQYLYTRIVNIPRRLKSLNNYLIFKSKSEDVDTPDTLMINDLFNSKHEESKLSYNIYHDYSVRNLNTNNTKKHAKRFYKLSPCKKLIKQ